MTVMAQYDIRDTSSGFTERIEAASDAEAIAAAEQWCRDGEWDTSQGSVFVSAYVFRVDSDGEAEDETVKGGRVSVVIDPPEPECTEDKHDWERPYYLLGGLPENPGVWGHGGGVEIFEVCMNCGTERKTDTWATNPEDGTQGHESISYEEGKYADRIAEMNGALG